MKNRIAIFIDQLGSSYWFIPAALSVAAMFLSVVTVAFDQSIVDDTWIIGVVYVNSADGARTVLSTVASSMISVAGVVFSLTMVVLTLSSQQYGPLVLTHFMRDRANQTVLGVFTATFIYCLLVLRTIRSVDEVLFVPHVSVLIGLGMAVASLAVLIFFIHHVAESIQATSIITRVSNSLSDGIDEIFPDRLGREAGGDADVPEQTRRRFEAAGLPIRAKDSGYLQMVDEDELMEQAQKHGVVIHIDMHPGRFLVQGHPLARVLPLDPEASTPKDAQRLTDDIAEAFILGTRRTKHQDIELLFSQLVSIGVRALSPGINDPYTAMMCIDRLTQALCEVLQRKNPSIYRYDEDGTLRVIVESVNFDALFHTTFDQIRHYGRGDLKLGLHLLNAISIIGAFARDERQRAMLARYEATVYQECRAQFEHDEDWAQLDRAYNEAVHDLAAAPVPPKPTD